MGRTGELGLIAVGGGVGALVRYFVAEALPSAGFPWSTFTVNVLGCGLLALATAPTRTKSHQRILGTGFCGGLTTFSTFAVEVANRANDGNTLTAIVYLLASLAAGLAVFIAIRAAAAPGPAAPTPRRTT